MHAEPSLLNGALLRSAVVIMTPLLFAATGGLFCELSGMLNIALEGLLLTGAFAAIAGFYAAGSFTAAVVSAVFASLTLACILGFTTLKLKSNVFITGLAANLLASGVITVISHRVFNTRGVVRLAAIPPLPRLHLPLVSDIPLVGALLSGHYTYIYASWLLLAVAWIILYRTPAGLRLRACGGGAAGRNADNRDAALDSLGIRSNSYRMAAFLLSGLYCGIGGSFLSLNLGAYVPNMPAGKGWIALVVIFLGGRKPAGIAAAAFVFGLAEALSNYAQGRFNVPADFILAAPYLFTLATMVAVSIFARK